MPRGCRSPCRSPTRRPPRRADRDGHRLRLPQRQRRRGRRRRPGAGRRLGRDDGARLSIDDPRLDRGAADARPRRPPRPARRRSWSATCRSAPTRSPTSRRSRRRCGSSRRPAATRSSSSAATRPRSRAPARSSQAGIPVMGHVGLTPQTSTALGGYRAQGRSSERGRPDRPGGARAPGGRVLLDRVRGDPGRGRRGADAAAATSR